LEDFSKSKQLAAARPLVQDLVQVVLGQFSPAYHPKNPWMIFTKFKQKFCFPNLFFSLHCNASIDLGGLQYRIQIFGKKTSSKLSHVGGYPLKPLRIVVPKVLV
jgi:hypothetical protein